MARSPTVKTPSRKGRSAKSGSTARPPRIDASETQSVDNQLQVLADTRLSPELANLLAARETRMLMDADEVGLEQLITALLRIPIPRRKS